MKRWSVPVALLGLFVVYCATLLRGVGWGDVAKYQHESFGPGIEVPLLAGLHPWHHVLSRIWNRVIPFDDVALAQNLLSAVISFATVCVFVSFLRRMGASTAGCLLATGLLGLSHLFWSLAVVAESYPLFSLFWMLMIGNMVLYLREGEVRHLCAVAFWLGIGMGNNLMQPFALPAVLLAAMTRGPEARRPTFWIRPAGWGLLGLSPLLLRVLVARYAEGLDWNAISALVFDQKYQKYLFWKHSLGEIVTGMKLFVPMAAFQFGVALLALSRLRRLARPENVFFATLILTMFVFCSTYLFQRSMFLLIAAWVPLAFWIALSFEKFDRGSGMRHLVSWSPAVTVVLYLAVPHLAGPVLARVPIAPIGERDPVKVFLQPWKHDETSAADFVLEVESSLSSGDVLLADFTPGAPVTYARKVEGRLRDIDLRTVDVSRLDGDIDRLMTAGRRIWLARDPGQYAVDLSRWRFLRKGSLWLIESGG